MNALEFWVIFGGQNIHGSAISSQFVVYNYFCGCTAGEDRQGRFIRGPVFNHGNHEWYINLVHTNQALHLYLCWPMGVCVTVTV